MKEYKIAMIGCGMISKSHLAAIDKLENARCIAVADIIEEKARSAGEKAGSPWFIDAEAMLRAVPEIEVCIISLPTCFHEEYVALCAKYGKAVLCEKPFTMTEASAVRMKQTIERTGIPYMTAQVVRFWTGYTRLKQMLDDGEFGELYMSCFSRCSERQSWDNKWLFDPENGGGAMYDMMVHDLDFLNYLFGDAASVFTLASKDDTGCYDNVFASVTYKNGAKAVVETAFNMHTGFPFTMNAKIMGNRAAAELYYSAGYDINQRDGATATLKIFREGQPPELTELEQYDAYAKQLCYFLRCLENGEKPSVVTPAQSVEVIRLVNAIRRSADCGEIVRLP